MFDISRYLLQYIEFVWLRNNILISIFLFSFYHPVLFAMLSLSIYTSSISVCAMPSAPHYLHPQVFFFILIYNLNSSPSYFCLLVSIHIFSVPKCYDKISCFFNGPSSMMSLLLATSPVPPCYFLHPYPMFLPGTRRYRFD